MQLNKLSVTFKTDLVRTVFCQVSKLIPYVIICFGYCSVRRLRDSAVGIATGYGLDDRQVGGRVPVRS
jgi:hypothetical protein